MIDPIDADIAAMNSDPNVKLFYIEKNELARWHDFYPDRMTAWKRESPTKLGILQAVSFLNSNIVDLSEHRANRGERRRWAREIKREPPPVSIVDLRTIVHREEPSGEHRDVDWSCRWKVKAHKRSQPYGPGRKLRKIIWIPMYIKGPADKPLRPTVYRVRR